MNLFLRRYFIIYIAKTCFACLIFHTCFVHEILRLDAIERYIVTIYHIVAKNDFPKQIYSHFTEGLDLYCPIYWVYLSPEGVVLNPEGFALPHFWDYLPPKGVVLLPNGN